MPPIRSLPVPKPTRTERTHEENQERAYIAASRRSDRSLEARIESARRASEIHKRRTGRSLRVTEADVINEEMYEEEDDDLPMQYRRLTAHLNGNSSDFNRRLAAYLTNSVAMRSALGQAMNSTYNPHFTQPWQQGNMQQQQQQQNSPANQQQSPQPMQQQQTPTQFQPWAPRQSQMGQPMYQSSHQMQMMNPQMMHLSSPAYRRTPYTVPQNQQQQSKSNGAPARSASIAEPQLAQSQNASVTKSPPAVDRRSSLPAHLSPSDDNSAPISPATVSSLPITTEEHQPAFQFQDGSNAMLTPAWSPSQQSANFNPLTTNLPGDSQAFFGMGFEHNGLPSMPFGMDPTQNTGYVYEPNASSKPRSAQSFHPGMHQTLAPSALDEKFGKQSWPTPTSADADLDTADKTINEPTFAWDDSSNVESLKHDFGGSVSFQDGGQDAPNDYGFSAFIDESTWDEPATTAL